MVRGAGLERLEMRRRAPVRAGWCWVIAAAAAADSGAAIFRVWNVRYWGLLVSRWDVC